MHGQVGLIRVAQDDVRPSPCEAEDAVRTLIRWIGDRPEREGLLDTPSRVLRAFEEWFDGYDTDPEELLQKTFEEVGGYEDLVVLRDIPFQSWCEHHMAPVRGTVHIGYLPQNRVVGISKLARVADAFARRLQVQERLTAQIADTIQEVLKPRGVGVVVRATHACMAERGVRKHGASMVTNRMLGALRDDPAIRQQFLAAIG